MRVRCCNLGELDGHDFTPLLLDQEHCKCAAGINHPTIHHDIKQPLCGHNAPLFQVKCLICKTFIYNIINLLYKKH